MPQKDTSGIGERIPRELIEADFTVAFSFVQMAEDELRQGNGQLALPLLQKAERTLEDIKARLPRMTASQKEPIESRCAELAAAIEAAKTTAAADLPGRV